MAVGYGSNGSMPAGYRSNGSMSAGYRSIDPMAAEDRSTIIWKQKRDSIRYLTFLKN